MEERSARAVGIKSADIRYNFVGRENIDPQISQDRHLLLGRVVASFSSVYYISRVEE